MFYRFKYLDCLIVNGDNQKNFLIKYLKWPKKKIKIEKSLRYQLNDKLISEIKSFYHTKFLI